MILDPSRPADMDKARRLTRTLNRLCRDGLEESSFAHLVFGEIGDEMYRMTDAEAAEIRDYAHALEAP